MDPSPNDPCVVFIHPPFTTFPDSERHREGLCYQILADNPEWFLDPRDFIHENNDNPHAVPYPPILEPPRGWCPARKKDLKERGAEGWPEGEEPRLRCTFCRRTYAGVNAKSMWRRHVFEKHKIAMANRRDANDRGRGRGSGKENKTSAAKAKEDSCDKLLELQVAPELDPQANAEASPHTSQFRSAPPPSKNARPKRVRKKDQSMTPDDLESPPAASGSGANSVESEPEFADAPTSLHTPPQSPTLQAQLLGEAIPFLATPGPVPPSPYDPLTQPEFRHSPPPLPSDHPWRFPSPSHPLHSDKRDMPLTMLAPSPLVKTPVPSGISPQLSPFSTPNASRSSDLKTPSTLGLSLKSGPRPWFLKDYLGSPLDRHSKSKGHVGSSPLTSSLRGASAGQKRNISALSDDWFSDTVLGPDPFAALQSPWPLLSAESSTPKSGRSLGDASPVLRAGSTPVDFGLLMTPFSFTKRLVPTIEDIDAELEEMDNPGAGRSTLQSLTDISLSGSPPLKRRRLV